MSLAARLRTFGRTDLVLEPRDFLDGHLPTTARLTEEDLSFRFCHFEIELAGTSITVNRAEGDSEAFTEVLSTDAAGVADSDYFGLGVGEFADYAIDDIRVTDSDAPPPDTPLADALYAYDALGRLAGQEVDGVKTWFVYDGDRVIEERDDTGALIAAYYYGLYVDEAVRMDRGGQSYYFHQDDLYNVVAVSDINGALAERYEYGDYGLPDIYDPNGVPLDASAIGNPFLFTGRRWHPELQLYHYRTRFMDPVMGRFISRDTIGLYGDPANLGNPNAYVGNNPWSRLDPWGRNGGYLLGAETPEMLEAERQFSDFFGIEEKPIEVQDQESSAYIKGISHGLTFGLYNPIPDADECYSQEANALYTIGETFGGAGTSIVLSEVGGFLLKPAFRAAGGVARRVAPSVMSRCDDAAGWIWRQLNRPIGRGGSAAASKAPGAVASSFDDATCAGGQTGRSRAASAGKEAEYSGGRFCDLDGGIDIERHHMPADSISPLPRHQGPAIEMDRWDHYATSSWGPSEAANTYRGHLGELIDQGKGRSAMVVEIWDVRNAAKSVSGDASKYNSAILEMLEYAQTTGMLKK